MGKTIDAATRQSRLRTLIRTLAEVRVESRDRNMRAHDIHVAGNDIHAIVGDATRTEIVNLVAEIIADTRPIDLSWHGGGG